MNHEANAVLEQAKQVIANPQPTKPTTPDFSTMSVTDAVRWCRKNGVEKPQAISNLTGKPAQSIYTALWKIRHPKRSKRLNRESKARREVKIQLISDATKKAKPTKTLKPIIENGRYDDGMETPFLDALNRTRTRYDLLERSIPTPTESELMAENRRLKILVEHYETLLFKGGK